MNHGPVMPSCAEAEAAVRTLLRYIGEDPARPGLQDTPARVLRAWVNDWGRGYQSNGNDLLRLFEHEGGKPYDQMVVVRDINMWSCCEHHMAPFFGVAHVAYIPGRAGVVGLSKLARVVDHFSRRLQVQERLTNEIAAFLGEKLSPHVGVVMSATHTCMSSRGVQQPNARTVTSALLGDFKDDPTTRQEFLRLAQP